MSWRNGGMWHDGSFGKLVASSAVCCCVAIRNHRGGADNNRASTVMDSRVFRFAQQNCDNGGKM
jgi:hypothetical protein